MRKILTIIILLSCCVCLSCCMEYDNTDSTQKSNIRIDENKEQSDSESEKAKLTTIGDYDMLQTLFCIIDKDKTYDEVLDLLEQTDCYYQDIDFGANATIEIAKNKPVKTVYSSNIYDSDYIEISFKEDDKGQLMVYVMEYYFGNKNVKAIYSFDRGITESDLKKAKEEYVFVDMNDEKVYTFRTIDCGSKEECLNCGIEYSVN